MSIAVVTGSAGLIGSEAARFFAAKGLSVVGIDNDLRSYFFGPDASTRWNLSRLRDEVKSYTHYDEDIRDADAIDKIFERFGSEIEAVVHAAAQPSHDWAAREPQTDFGVNANGTLNLLESCRRHCEGAVFMFLSTNKVYGDGPNRLPFVEHESRWELDPDHPYFEAGIDEEMSVDRVLHSLFGASKLAADVLVQEYGRYFGMRTVCFRGGCLTGPGHSGAELHGFLAYLVKCAVTGTPYTICGYKGKQVRDNIHSLDLVNALWRFFRNPRSAEVYNIGGGRSCNCSVLEAIRACEALTGKPMEWITDDQNRSGDHIWWISDTRRFESHFPSWRRSYDLDQIFEEIYQGITERAHVQRAN